MLWMHFQQTPFALLQDVQARNFPSSLLGVAPTMPTIPAYAMESMMAAAKAAAEERSRLDHSCPPSLQYASTAYRCLPPAMLDAPAETAENAKLALAISTIAPNGPEEAALEK